MGRPWTDAAVSYLADAGVCPRCDYALGRPESCANCGADLSGEQATALRAAAQRAAEALRERQSLADALPSALAVAPAVPVAPAASATSSPVAAPASVGAVPAPAPRASSQVSVQSVLAVAGAGLFAVAAIVFTFLNPDLTDFATRTTIIAITTLVFLGAAWMLARKGILFSAEAIGALGAVFVALDVWAFSETAPNGVSAWAFGGLGSLIASVALVWIGHALRLRSWLWTGLLGLSITPAFFGYAVDSPWSPIVGHLAVGFAALGAHLLAERVSARFDSTLRTERVTSTVLRLAAVAVVVVQLVVVGGPTGTERVLGTSAILVGISVLAALGIRTGLGAFWGFLAGAAAVTASALVPFAVPLDDDSWYLAAVPAAAALALALLAGIRVVRPARGAALLRGAFTVAVIVTVPAFVGAVRQVLLPLITLPYAGGVTRLDAIITGVDPSYGIAVVLGVAALAVGAFTMSRFDARSLAAHGAPYRGAVGATSSLWIGMFALVALVPWPEFLPVTRAALGLLLALGLSGVLTLIRPMAAASGLVRSPLVTAAHVLLAIVALDSWVTTDIRVPVGAAIVAVLVVVAQTVPQRARPWHVGFGFAYALGIVAAGLALARLETIAVLCLTTAIAALAALVATRTRWLTNRSWYAVLIVTSIPFLIGIGSVLAVRSGWTALSTGVTFALALALVTTTRPGLTLFLRAVSAALLVPSLAVVVISLGAQLLDVSASPITLPMIAVIVACTLPSTGMIGAALERHGIGARAAAVSRLWIEISALVTAAFAVLLAIVRAAAGLPTTFLVLLIVGIGAAATALFAKRRYGWVVAWASWSGALWCVWALAGIDIVEPYLLPPTLIAALVAAYLVGRGVPGFGIPAVGLYVTGLAAAIVPVLVILAVAGSGADSPVAWRAWGLLASALLLLLLGLGLPRIARRARFARLIALRTPTLVLAIISAAAGTIQAVRYGWRLDPLRLESDELVMAPVLGMSVLAFLLAAAAGRSLLRPGNEANAVAASLSSEDAAAPRQRTRWLYAPALGYLALGTIAGIRPGWFPILTLLALSLGLLALMLVTVARARTRAVTLPPVWFTFALAWCTAVASWSERELRVEAFSLPLGLALLTAGVIAMRPQAYVIARPNLTSWPNGHEGSWRLLTPGIVVTLVPSMLATVTDPLTLRAILVIALALAAILLGSLLRLAAPFILGIIALPVENVLVFAVQIGRNIGALPWWITLATAGAVLFVIAVGSERRTARARGDAARVGDLR